MSIGLYLLLNAFGIGITLVFSCIFIAKPRLKKLDQSESMVDKD